MIVFGCTTNPINVLLWIKENKIKYSFNSLRILCRVVIFPSVFDMMGKATKLGRRCVIVFDALEKLQTIQGIRIINKSNMEFLHNYLLNNMDTNVIDKISLNKINYINQTIESNKSSGLMDVYNTSLYAISNKEARDQIKQLILSYVSGDISQDQIKKVLEELYEARRNTATKETIKNIINLITSDEFTRLRGCLITLIKSSTTVDNTMVESVCLANKVEPFDVRYLFSVITKHKL